MLNVILKFFILQTLVVLKCYLVFSFQIMFHPLQVMYFHSKEKVLTGSLFVFKLVVFEKGRNL